MSYHNPPPNPPIATEKLVIDRKAFFLDLKENARGRYIKITEDADGRRDTIILPIGAATEFIEVFRRLAEFEATLGQ